MKAAHIIVTGFVQGVGYRKFFRDNARKYGLKGWVRNIPNGKVEAFVVGQEDSIHTLLTLCKKGPFLSEVKTIDVLWEETEEAFAEFLIRHDF
jgi:acylphosphatase